MSNVKSHITSVMKTLEVKGEQQVKNLVSTGNIEEDKNKLINIIKEGGKEFEQKMGRPMTYAEMRDMYG
jgi:hypothetical protein